MRAPSTNIRPSPNFARSRAILINIASFIISFKASINDGSENTISPNTDLFINPSELITSSPNTLAISNLVLTYKSSVNSSSI